MTHQGSAEENLSEWSAQVRSLPTQDEDLARSLVLDSLGVMASGSVTSVGSSLAIANALEEGEHRACPVIGGHRLSTPRTAALSNGTSGAAELWDDTSLSMLTHPSVPVTAALLSSHTEGIGSLGDFLRSFRVGIEMEMAVAELSGDEPYRRGFHATGLLGAIGAAAAYAHAEELDWERMAHALGIAASLSAGLRVQFGADVMPLHSGFAAEHGVQAVQMARSGLRSDRRWLTGPNGFLHAFAGVENAKRSWSGPAGLPSARIVIKRYPVGAPNVAPVDAALRARGQAENLHSSEIHAVHCRVHEWVSNTVHLDLPKEAAGGRVSLPYCLAAALVRGEHLASAFVGDGPPDPDIVAVAERLSVETADTTDANGRPTAEVDVTTSRGHFRAAASPAAYIRPGHDGAEGDALLRKFRSNWGTGAAQVEHAVLRAPLATPMAQVIQALDHVSNAAHKGECTKR